MLRSRTTAEFWTRYRRLPLEIRLRANKQYRLFCEDPRHPSLRFKSVGIYWSVRVNEEYRALARRERDTVTWFFIGTHDEYKRLIAQKSTRNPA